MDSQKNPVNRLQLGIGFLALCLGVLIYLGLRPEGSVYFLVKYNICVNLSKYMPVSMKRVGNVLPEFLHVFAFILITGGIFSRNESGGITGYRAITFFWTAVDSLFEIGQKFSQFIVKFIPSWFSGIPFLESTENYFKHGTFDWLDLGAIFAGSFTAYLVLLTTRGRRQ